MATHELGGNIILSGFKLDEDEMIVAKKMVGKYAEKIRNFQEYRELKLEMKSHSKNKTRVFEMKAFVELDGAKKVAEARGNNPFVVMDETMQKVLNEVKHLRKDG